MDCPRCESTLDRYALFGKEAVHCEDCGYLGVTVDHESEPREIESWDAAFERFREGTEEREGGGEGEGRS